MSRPLSIVRFELITIGSLSLGGVQMWLGWNSLQRAHQPLDRMLTILLISVITMVTLVLFVSRARSRIAMWVLVGMFVLGLPFFFETMLKGQFFGSSVIGLVQTVAQGFALTLLFTPSARAWFRREDEAQSPATAFE